jgi:DNA-binding CsgD family transcriptional regulator
MTFPWAAMTFLAGATTCMGMLRNYELATKAADAGTRIDAGSLALPLLGGIALFLTVYWLDPMARTIVFYQLNSLAFLLLLAALQASRKVNYASPMEPALGATGLGAAGLGAAGHGAVPGTARTDTTGHGAAAHNAVLPDAAPPDAAPPLRLNRYTHLVMFAFQLACGYCLGMTIQFWAPLTVGIASCIAAVLCLLYFYLAKRTALALGELGKVALPLCVAMTFAVLSAAPVLTAVTLATALAFFILFEIMNTYWLVKTAASYGLVTARHVASGRLPLAIGTVCGLLLAFISQCTALALLQDSGTPPDQFVEQFVGQPVGQSVEQIVGQLTALRLITSGLIAIVVVVAYTLLPFNRGTPVKEGIINSDMAKSDTPDTQATRRAGQDKPFHDFCFSFGQSHGLTSREQEVLFLLSCGYNSETIAEILIVSTSTVRTHVYRIYQKTDIHSQQELIRCIDYGFRAQKNSSPPLCGSSKS